MPASASSPHRMLLGLLVAILAVALLPGRAHGHGGQFRAPGGPPPTGPGLGPVPVPRVVTPGETWQTWWDLNRAGLLPGRDTALRRQVTTPGEGRTESLEDGWARRRQLAAQKTVVPYLVRLIDPQRKTRDEVRAAALIALGKVSGSRAVHPLLLRWLHASGAKPLVRESAALAIGLLRRSKPSLQADGATLDGLRGELLKALGDRKADDRVRAFAAIALGLLGDQPYGSTISKDGRLVTRALWARLAGLPKLPDIPAAILVALGLQPPAGISDQVRDGLRQITLGKTVHGRRWSPLERSHAFTALLRVGAPGVHALVLNVLRRPSEPVELRRAAYLALDRLTPNFTKEERIQIAKALVASLERKRDPMTFGLGLIAAGRLLGRDLGEGRIDLLDAVDIPRVLLDAVKRGTNAERGYGAVALALAASGAKTSGIARPLLERAKNVLLDGLRVGRGDDRLRASYAVGMGLLDVPESVDQLLEVVRDIGADQVLRGHAAVALGQMGRRRLEVLPVLISMLREKRGVMMRVRAASAIALLGGRLATTKLLEELKDASSEYHRAHVVIALGRLGDLTAISELLAYTQDEQYSELARALGVVALGMLTDPEPRPSILRITEDANYPAATQTLYSAYSIF